MKARSLVSCILLSILVILLLSSAVQATEFREVNTEVKADDILKHIENGEDINLTNCHIVGELDTSKIKLETVPNPLCTFLLNKGFDKEDLIYNGLNENFSIIKSNITVKNSIFEHDVNFSNILFKNFVCFYNTNFNDIADFNRANFSNNVNFTRTNFKDDAKFYRAGFDNNADFTGAKFNGLAYFHSAEFNGLTKFSLIDFNGVAVFNYTNFNGFYADFTGTNFNDYAEFDNARFHGSTYFNVAKFNNLAYFTGTDFNDSASFVGPETSENIITQGKCCDLFKTYYQNEGQYTDADNVYYNYRKYADSEDLTSYSKWINILNWISGYGLRPEYLFIPVVIIIGIFSLLYWKFQGIHKSLDPKSFNPNEKEPKVSFLDALLFSIREFTTLGSSDWCPEENFRILVTLEGLLGWIMLGIFMATLTNVMIRS